MIRRHTQVLRLLPALLWMAISVNPAMAEVTEGAARLPSGPSPPSVPEVDLLERAFETHERFDQDEWAYTLTRVEDGTIQVARHDPRRSETERWTLVSVDGARPRSAQLEKFRREHIEAPEEEAESSGDEVRAMISPGSAKLVEDTDHYALYSFEVASEDEEDDEFNRHLEATLRVVKTGGGPYVESIELLAAKPFSPVPGVKIKAFSTVMTYAPVGPRKAVLPSTVEVRLTGRAFLVKKLEQTVDVRFENYREPDP